MELLYPERSTLKAAPQSPAIPLPRKLGAPPAGMVGSMISQRDGIDFRLGTANRRSHPEYSRASAAGDLLYPDRPQTQARLTEQPVPSHLRQGQSAPQHSRPVQEQPPPQSPPPVPASQVPGQTDIFDNTTGRITHSAMAGLVEAPITRRELQYRNKQQQRQQQRHHQPQPPSRPQTVSSHGRVPLRHMSSAGPPNKLGPGPVGKTEGDASSHASPALSGVPSGMTIQPALPPGLPPQPERSVARLSGSEATTASEAEAEITALKTQVAALTNMLQQGVHIDMDEIMVASTDAGEGASLHVRCNGSGWQWRCVDGGYRGD